MAIWKEGEFMSWHAELGAGLDLGVFRNPTKLDPDRPYEVRVFRYHTTRAATREEAQQAAERIAREALSQALAALDAKDDGKDGETMSNDTTKHTPDDVRERVKEPTQAQIDDACLWYRHDFGLLSEKERDSVRFEARQWFRAWGKALSNGDDPAALLRTPRGEGEDSRLAQIVRAILERIDRYQAFHDRVGPADLTLPPVARTITEEEIFALRAALRSEAQGDGPVGAVCANCGAPNAAIAGGELDPDEAVCSVECDEQLRELGCPQEHGGTYRPKPARRGEGGGK